MRVSRRALMLGAGASALGSVLPLRRSFADAQVKEIRLVAKSATVNLTGRGHPDTAVWAYDGAVPGPEIRIRQGDRLRVAVSNKLGEATTVHWHGIRLPNAMDGVPGVTQPPIQRGESFTYEFTPPDAGTFWYHPHADTLQQLGRGLAGALVVEERAPPPVDRDLLWFIEDWRLDDGAQIAPGFDNRMEAAMSGRIGNTVTINGSVPDRISVKAGERLRVRVVNAAIARIIALRFVGHQPVVVAYDGQPCDPHTPESGRLVLGPAMRADVILDMQGMPGRGYTVTDDFYGELAYRLVELAYELGKPMHDRPPAKLPDNPLPEPDLNAAERHEIALQGGMMGGMGMMRMGGAAWAMNGRSMTGDGEPDMPPLLTLRQRQSCVLTLRNETAWWHPMHLHGHSFRVISRNGEPNPLREWRDTVLVPPRESAEVAFVADNPGDWMFHCHVTDHQEAGMMSIIRVA
ncbi:MAG TPA: multicopper oxidase family protein [Stellaceae bacterium]|nr:multicopper oxidase family protein [Stellaceae bacterium]